MDPRAGYEPAPSRLEAGCSALNYLGIELMLWIRGLASNQRLPGPKPGVLPLNYPGAELRWILPSEEAVSSGVCLSGTTSWRICTSQVTHGSALERPKKCPFQCVQAASNKRPLLAGSVNEAGRLSAAIHVP